MKKLVLIGMLLLMMSMVAAQPIQLKEQSYMEIQNEIRNMTQLRLSEVDGLEQARLMVQNEIAAQAIERNLERLQERNRLMIQNMSQLEIAQGENDTAIVQGRTQARFLNLIRANREMTLVVDENGEVTRIGRPFDFLFRYEETMRNIQVE